MEYLSVYLSVLFSCYDYQDNINGKESTHEGSRNKYPWLIKPCDILFWPKHLKFSQVQPLISETTPPGSCFNWVLSFSMLKSSVDEPWRWWIYLLILHIHLDLYSESNWRLLKSSNSLSLHWGTRIRKNHSFNWISTEHWKIFLIYEVV